MLKLVRFFLVDELRTIENNASYCLYIAYDKYLKVQNSQNINQEKDDLHTLNIHTRFDWKFIEFFSSLLTFTGHTRHYQSLYFGGIVSRRPAYCQTELGTKIYHIDFWNQI